MDFELKTLEVVSRKEYRLLANFETQLTRCDYVFKDIMKSISVEESDVMLEELADRLKEL